MTDTNFARLKALLLGTEEERAALRAEERAEELIRLFREWSAGEGGGYPCAEVVSVS